MKFIITILIVSAVAAVDVVGLPVRLKDTASKNTSFVSNHRYLHNVLNPDIFTRKIASEDGGSHGDLVQVPSHQAVKRLSHLEDIVPANDIQKHMLVRRIWEKQIKAAHKQASEAHTKAAAAHRQVQDNHAKAATKHLNAGNHIAAHDENTEAEKHAGMALAHEKASISHLNEAHPDLPRVKATVPQAIKSIILSKYDAHKAKKSLKNAAHRPS
ncbi:hypothetical protein JR316_0008966 [Psilocybe cubensis]|uniref:Uncharacterized protein n=2 Tax=Psilocybe cubensis TaxID=181762 RepID=A0ACB8GTE9_PSICU|nr:hypothetical protein JR316_0008966 [Psilocybe cubensis]KAH9478511.1 hypothetical protein JR316_0008966 [Psilocybe cubensis]